MLSLALPVVLSQVGQVVVQLADNIMVGRLGAVPLAAVSFSNSVFFMLFILAIGLSMGITPLVGDSYARHRYSDASRLLQNSLLLYPAFGLMLFAIMWTTMPLLGRLGQPAEVVEIALPYYRYVVLSIIPFMFFAPFKQFLEGVGNTTTAMVVVIGGDVMNVILNWVLIYGHWGMEPMGAAGAGLATMISRFAMAAALVIAFVCKNSYRRYFKFFAWERFSFKTTGRLFGVGMPIALQSWMEAAAFCITGIMAGWIGTTAIASNQIANTIANVAFMIVLGISSAATIRVSHARGTGDRSGIRDVAVTCYTIGLMWNMFAAMLFIALRHQIPLIFTDDPDVVRCTANLLIFCGLFQLSDGLQSISIGILRGTQDVKAIMRIAFVSYIVINLPLGWVMAFVFGWGVEGLWIGFIVGLTTAAALLYRRYRRTIHRFPLE